MTRFKMSLGILGIILMIGFFSCIAVNSRCNYFIREISYAENFALSGDIEKSTESIGQLEKQWQTFRKKASLVIHEEKLADTDGIFTDIINENDGSSVISGIVKLKHSFEMLRKAEIPDWTGIF